MEGRSQRCLCSDSAAILLKNSLKHYFFHMWIEEESIVRWMCSFDTTEDDIRKFAEAVAKAVRE